MDKMKSTDTIIVTVGELEAKLDEAFDSGIKYERATNGNMRENFNSASQRFVKKYLPEILAENKIVLSDAERAI